MGNMWAVVWLGGLVAVILASAVFWWRLWQHGIPDDPYGNITQQQMLDSARAN